MMISYKKYVYNLHYIKISYNLGLYESYIKPIDIMKGLHNRITYIRLYLQNC